MSYALFEHSSPCPDAMSVMSLLVVWHNDSLQNPYHIVLHIIDIIPKCITARLQLIPVP